MNLPVFLINRNQDADRLCNMQERLRAQNIPFERIKAIDGHGALDFLAPYQRFLGTRFWNSSKIKPGAFACFLSHRKVWETIVTRNLHGAIIIEDDTRPVDNFWAVLKNAQLEGDILFLNNRIAAWTYAEIEPAQAIITHLIQIQDTPGQKVPGGDAYYLSLHGAKMLLERLEEDKITMGVDWYLLAQGWDRRKQNRAKMNLSTELLAIWKNLPKNRLPLEVYALGAPLFWNDRNLPSTIVHKDKVEISVLRQNLASALNKASL